MTEKEKLKHCYLCHDDYYNHNEDGKCWCLPDMVLVRKKEVSIDQVPPWDQPAKLLPKCYHRQRYIYVNPNVTH